jgi:hypothetical protein
MNNINNDFLDESNSIYQKESLDAFGSWSSPIYTEEAMSERLFREDERLLKEHYKSLMRILCTLPDDIDMDDIEKNNQIIQDDIEKNELSQFYKMVLEDVIGKYPVPLDLDACKKEYEDHLSKGHSYCFIHDTWNECPPCTQNYVRSDSIPSSLSQESCPKPKPRNIYDKKHL